MRKLIHVVIEPYEERYTEQWSRWWSDAAAQLGMEYYAVWGEGNAKTVETGDVLDAYGTNRWKAVQLERIIGMAQSGEIDDDDALLFHDLWFPGIEMLQYVRDIGKRRFKIWGIFHAGTWDKNDFLCRNNTEVWAEHLEHTWVLMTDKIFVGSGYHKALIEQKYPWAGKKIFVSGLPFEAAEVRRPAAKENIVVFPHRLAPEKSPEWFDRLATELGTKLPGWEFVKSKDVCKTKEEYYRLLGRSKIAVSFAKQETFGYAMLEAVANGCMPVVPDALSYETMDIYRGFRYRDYGGCEMMVKRLAWAECAPCLRQEELEEFETKRVLVRILRDGNRTV